jgi:hypothetical protein
MVQPIAVHGVLEKLIAASRLARHDWRQPVDRETTRSAMRKFLSAAAAAALLAGSVCVAADKPPQEAQSIRTLFVNKGSASAVLKSINALHAKMEAEGWKYQDMSVYTEDGDLEGVFVTYVRATAPATGADAVRTEGVP